MILQDQITKVVKHSIAYSFAFSQPFAFYVDAYPNELLEQTEMLQFGIQHESVKVLQHKLQKLSYYDSSIDGDFGLLTEYALKKFQNDYFEDNNGQVDNETVQTILEKEEVYYRDIIIDTDIDFSFGDTGDDVKELQEALFYFGYYLIEIDGIFGEKSKQALQQFEQDHGIESYHIKAEIKNISTNKPQTASETTTVTEPTTKEVKKIEKEEINESKQSSIKQTKNSHYNRDQIAATAKAFVGVPYLWGGTTTAGFDCSGYLQHVFNQLGVTLPRTVNDMWNVTTPVNQPSIGDLVFFETYKPGPSHAGIYVGNGKFIHAGESSGVAVSELNSNYWNTRYLGAKRITSK